MISRDGGGAVGRPDRRAFLKSTGAALLGVGWAGCASRPASSNDLGDGTSRTELGVRVVGDSDPEMARAWTMLRERGEERAPVTCVKVRSGGRIRLELDSELEAESFRLEMESGVVRIAGGSGRGLMHGIGKFLRTSRYDGGFQPSVWRGDACHRGAWRTGPDRANREIRRAGQSVDISIAGSGPCGAVHQDLTRFVVQQTERTQAEVLSGQADHEGLGARGAMAPGECEIEAGVVGWRRGTEGRQEENPEGEGGSPVVWVHGRIRLMETLRGWGW